MSLSKLPLSVRIGIRDHWDSADAPVRRALFSVKELLGIDVAVEIMWDFLFTNLGDEYPDKSTFVPSISAGVQAFLDALQDILDAEANPEWTDTLLERADGSLRLFIGVSKKAEPTVFWFGKGAGINVNLPKGPMPSPAEMQSIFKTKLLSCFDDQEAALDDWADVGVDDNLAVVESPQPADVLPDINVLPRPDELLLKPPYHLVVYGGGKSMVEVQCSHSPTLELLAEYLKKWCKINHHDTRRPPAVDVNLHQSSFSFGLIYDRLTMTIDDRNYYHHVSPVIVLSFVEGVLNYKSVSVDGSTWTFRRDVEFKKRKH
ncbi:hypothetical protein GGS26DRAFT_593995 [Hypomontagnella submonticulosa]|nr:hypothetical protein GGS26DRAFT_593995 [Hypomontagnella submonticulosa]